MKTNKILLGIALAFVIYLGISAFNSNSFTYIKGSGNVISETRELKSFHALDIGGAFEVNLRQGSPQSVKITSDDNLIPHIITKVKDGELEVYTKGNIQNATKLYIDIVVANIDKFDLSGACKLKTLNFITSNEMEIESSGASHISIQLKCKKLDLDFSGASNGRLFGSAKVLNIDASGACDLDCSKLNAEVVKIDASGASTIEVLAKKTIYVEASGASTVNYTGNAVSDIHTSGAANVEKE